MKVHAPSVPTRFGFVVTTASPRPVWLASLALVPFAIIGPNAALALYACLVLALGLRVLWRPGEPPILLFIFLYQWIQAAVAAFYGNLLGVPIDALTPYMGQDTLANFLQLTALLVLALAMRLAAGGSIRSIFPRIQSFVAARPLRFWIWIYVVAWIFSAACGWLASRSGGLRQPLLSLAEVKWAAFVLLTLATFAVPGRRKAAWLVVFGFEFLLSVGGFFASFKSVFFYALIGLVASNVRFKARMVLPAAVLAGVLLLFGLVWTAIKGEYRDFVNGGTGQQVVLVSYSDRISELGRLVSQLDGQQLSAAADQMIRRLMYFEFFGVVLDRVPDVIPYAGGEIWGEAILRPFMPRLLFPSKSAINDFELTNHYTGLGVASASQGTSISMGYMAEAYIDFGPFFMFAPIAMLGFFLGYLYRWLLRRPGQEAVLGTTLAPFALMPAGLLETSSLKMVPSLVLSVVACLVVLKVLAPRLFRLDRNGRRVQRLKPVRPVRR